jgi:hypothetical protein
MIANDISPTIDRSADVDRAIARVRSEGLEVLEPSDYHRTYGKVIIRGPRTGFLFEVTPERIDAMNSVVGWIIPREDTLIDNGWLHTPGPWYHVSERDHDDDSYQYDHFAVNRETGDRVYLDVGYSIPSLTPDEFRLHVMLGFPRRYLIGDGGPIRNGRLEAWLFRHCDGQG